MRSEPWVLLCSSSGSRIAHDRASGMMALGVLKCAAGAPITCGNPTEHRRPAGPFASTRDCEFGDPEAALTLDGVEQEHASVLLVDGRVAQLVDGVGNRAAVRAFDG